MSITKSVITILPTDTVGQHGAAYADSRENYFGNRHGRDIIAGTDGKERQALAPVEILNSPQSCLAHPPVGQ
jgi:hypothetical protein